MDKGFLSYVRKNKRIWKVILPLALGVILILVSSFVARENNETDGNYTLDEYKEKLEREIADICSDIEGVGNAVCL